VDRLIRRAIRSGEFVTDADVRAITAHVAKHVWAQRQWDTTTTAEQYLKGIRAAIGAETARLAVYERNRRPVAAIIAATHEAVPVDRLGPNFGPFILVMYSPDSAMIVTAYMLRGFEAARIPAGALWLR
jgi:hypothetical protein